jgi:hypothetical protein
LQNIWIFIFRLSSIQLYLPTVEWGPTLSAKNSFEGPSLLYLQRLIRDLTRITTNFSDKFSLFRGFCFNNMNLLSQPAVALIHVGRGFLTSIREQLTAPGFAVEQLPSKSAISLSPQPESSNRPRIPTGSEINQEAVASAKWFE